ncbi:MAG: acyl-CoA dehydrogenase family protein [Myxococcota bacterium]
MEFSFTETQESLYRAAQNFGSKVLAVDAPMTRDQWRACGEQGLLGLCVSEEHGGQGHDPVTTGRVLEGLGYGAQCTGRAFAMGAHLLAVCKSIEHFAERPEQLAVLGELVAGRAIGAFATTEAGAGSDIGAVQTRAIEEGDAYLLSGEKMFITNAPEADVFLVIAKTALDRGTSGLTAFLVPRDTPGLTVSPPRAMIGLHGASIGEVHLDDCRIPGSARLGGLHAGGQVAQHAMRWERALLLAPQLGVMQRQLESSVEHARTRVQFGKRIGAFQGVSHRIAKMDMRLEAARLLFYRGAWALTRGGREGTRAAAISKAFVSETAVEAHLDGLRLAGANGYTQEGGVDGPLRDALGGLLYSGTGDVQYNLIASLLGL